MAHPGSTVRRMQAVRDAGLRRLSSATVALTVASVAGVGVVTAVVKSATEHSAQRSAPASASTGTGTGQAGGSQQGGTGSSGSAGSGSAGSGTGSGSDSTDPGGSSLVPDQSGSEQIQPPAYAPAPAPDSGQTHASSGGS